MSADNVTISSLDIQIRSSAGSAAKNIDDLAKALGNLNASAKVTKTVNALNSLNNALTAMKSQQSTMSHLSALSKSLSSLASIPKLTGLQSAIRELKKLPEVMASLDTAQISQFAAKMKLLSNGLEPLAKQIDKIGTGFSKLPPQVSKCVTAVKRLDSANKSIVKSTNAHSNALNSQSFNLLATYEHLSNVFSMIHGIQNAIAKILNDAIQWDGIQARFGRAFGDDAQETLAWVDKLSESLMINKQEFMQYSSLFAEMLSGFGVNQADAGKMAIGYTELAYDIWAAYNDVYKSLGGEEGAIAAVRSAIAGEVEPIRRAGFTIVDSQLAVTAANHGLTYSTQKATEAQKSYLRYVTMVDQAIDKNIIGVYASEMQTAEGAVRTLTQQFKALGQAVGSLFLPILQNVLPYLTVFVQLLYDAAEAIAAFFGLPFFETNWSRGVDNSGLADFAQSADASTEALGGTAEAAKKLKQYTMGFDELNVIDPSSGASGGGASGGAGDGAGWDRMDVDNIWDESLFKQASKQVDELKQKIKDYIEEHKVMLSVVGAVTGFLTFMKVLRGLNSLLGITKTIGNLKTAFEGISKAASGIKTAGSNVKAFFDLLKSGSGLGNTLAAAFPKAANVLSTATTWVTGTLAPAIMTALRGLAATLGMSVGATALAIAGVVVAAIVAAFLIVKHWDKIKAFFTDTLPQWFANVKEKAGEFFSAAAEKVKEIWGKVADWFNDKVIQPIVNFFAPIVDWISTFFYGCWLLIQAVWVVVSDWFNENVVTPVVTWFKGLMEDVGNFFTQLWNGIKSVWNVVSDWFNKTVVKPIVSKFMGLWTNVSSYFSQLWEEVKGVWSIVATWFVVNVISPVTRFFKDAWTNIKESFKDAFTGIRDFAVGIFNGIIGTVESVINFIIRAINGLLDSFNSAVAWAADILGKDWEGVSLINEVSLGRIQVEKKAAGGFVGAGQMFIAREAGPELVGNINGRTAVANNDQIVTAVSRGVYEAVAAAMGANRGAEGQSINVYLDGRQITAAVEKRQGERGVSLMGNQLGYAY